MYLRAFQIFKFVFLLTTLLLVQQTECKRKGGGGRRTGGGGSHTTPRSTNYHQNNDDRAHQTNTYQTNSNVPSAPIPPSSGNTNIGFENFNQPHGTSFQGTKQGPIGFENVQNRVPLQNSQSGAPIGFNVPQQGHQPSNPTGFNVPQQNHQPSNPTGFNVHQPSNTNGINSPPNYGSGYPPQGGPPNTHYQPNYNNYNPQTNTGNYHPNYNQFGGNNGFNPHLQGGTYHNPNLAQPGSYYNPHYGVPGGAPPPIYQPVQQSSGSSFLGYAGSFAGGYLIGKLTSGGHDSGDRQYTVHHYHHNRDEVPKQTSVSNNSLVVCSQNETKGFCVPNTFPICLVNGTILCVTHLPYTVPCGQNQSMSCVITVLPCANGTNCNTTDNSTSTTAVYVPCISNVTLAKPSELQDMNLPAASNTTMNQTSSNNTTSTSNTTTNESQSNKKVELCVTAIAEPKVAPKMKSAAPAFLGVIEKLLEFPLQANFSSEMSFGDSANGTDNKTSVIYVST